MSYHCNLYKAIENYIVSCLFGCDFILSIKAVRHSCAMIWLDPGSISEDIFVTNGSVLLGILLSEPCHFWKRRVFCWANHFVRANILYKMTSVPVI